ncbi:MAG: tyrosine-protein phosphatase [Gaiellaceae bacterium]
MSRVLAWDGCVNVRDLGGLPTEDGGVTRSGCVVRGDKPSRLTDAGWQALAAHGIRTVVDLRAAEELADESPPRIPVDVVRVALMSEHDHAYMTQTAATLEEVEEVEEQFRLWYLDTLERHREPVRRALEAIADAPAGGVFVHCVGGRDRTGIVAALLLRLAGVSVADAAEDYAATAEDTPREAMAGVLAELDRRYRSVAGYLREIGLDEARLARLRERLR